MATKPAQPAPLRSREVRLGVVMYGGVSLAIYIYGVAREFFDAVRGRGLFKLVKALTDSDIAVDVISGTSAGGINGILLAYCLTNELEFAAASSTWRDEGGIRALLRDPGKNIDSTKSVLQGDDYFLPRLTETFERLATRPIDASSEDGDPSALSEVDLFVTSTDVDGRIETWIDAAGHPIDVKDHRAVFHLKHRAGRKEPLNPKFDKKQSPAQTFRALGKLARATSSFPAAFEPVHLAHEPAADCAEDASLGRWGWGDIGTDRDVYLVDGGVLDNKPFTSTIREIFYRLTERKVERKLLYVEPDPEVFERLRAVEEPNLLRVVVGSLSSIPAYESIIGDLKMLAEHNDQVERFRRLIRHQRAGAVPLDGDTTAFITRVGEWETLAPESNGSEAPATEGGASTKKPTPLPVEDAPPLGQPSSYSQSRLVAISERVVQGMLRIDGRGTQLTERERRAAARLLEAYDGWPGNGDFTLYNFDVEFRIRRMFHTLYACPKPPPGDGDEFRRARRVLNRQEKLLEIIRNAMERVLDEGIFAWQPTEDEQAAWEGPAGANEWKKFAFDLWRKNVGSALMHLLDVGEKAEPLLPADYGRAWNGRDEDDGWLDQEALDAVHAALGIRIARVKKALVDKTLDELRPPPASFRSVLRFTDACERRILGRMMGIKAIVDGQPTDRPLIDEYANFSRVDAVVFPLQSFVGLHEQDIIKTVRISPLDAQRGFSARSLDEKVSGDAVSHFGGFFKKSWRSNDILWGRLDGVCQLAETLLDPVRIEEVMKEDSLSRALAASLKEDLDAARLFPRSPEPTIRTLRTWLEDVSSGDAKKRGDALKPARFNDILGLLIEAQQLEILHEEVPSVIEDAISEQTQWNSYRVAKRHASLERSRPAYDPDRAAFFQRGDGDLDPLVAATAAGTLAQRAARRIRNRSARMPSGARPSDTPFGLFFREKYCVGSEALTRDVPTVVLLEILSTALLVTRNCVVTLFGRRASEVRKSAAYRIISGTLWAFDGMVALLAGGAGRVLGVMAGLTVIALLALGVGITWWTPIIAPEGTIKARWLTVFILGPAALLLIEIWLLAQVAWRGRATSEDPLSTRNPLVLVPPRLAPGLITVLIAIAAGAAGLLWFTPGADPGFQARFLATPSLVPSDAGKIAWYWGSVVVDYVLLVAHSLGLSLWALQVARRLAVRASFLWTLGVPLAWLALLGGAVDAVENGALLLLLSQGGAAPHSCLYEMVYTAGRACSLVKLFAPTVVGVYCVVGLVWSFFLKPSAVSASPAGRGRPALRKTAPATA